MSANVLPVDLFGISARFWSKVDRRSADDCWPWLAYRDRHGYGKFHVLWNGHRRTVRAHAVAYWLAYGEDLPINTEPDHICRNPGCVNPAHLEPVTHLENVRRGIAGQVNGARIRGKTHCPAGHPYDEANIYRRPDGGRGCRACNRETNRRYRARKRVLHV